MRELKFRGRTSGSNEWVYGSYQADVMHQGTHTILYCDYEGYYMEEDVEPETVGQYTGFLDKNGNEIYEGDILKTGTSYDKVFWNKSAWSTEVMKRHQEKGGWIVGHINVSFDVSVKYGEVIGNIYDNPELITTQS